MKFESRSKQPRVCYFGTYESDYARNALLISGLRKNGVEVIECNEVIWRRRGYKYRGNIINTPMLKLRLLLKIIKKYLSLILRYRKLGHFDVLIIGYPGYLDMYLARIITLFQKKKIIFDAYFSLYDTVVCDRKLFAEKSAIAFFIYQLERLACKMADLILVETEEGSNYFAKNYGLKKDKFRRLYTSANDTIFFPRNTQEDNEPLFEVIYYGSFIPFHGVEYIIDAAENLRGNSGIKFRLIGDGQYRRAIETKLFRLNLPNVILDRWYEPEELAEIIAKSDACLGVFGNTDKARYCMTNKVAEALAMKKPVITGDSPAAAEIFTNRGNAILSPLGDGRALAEAILYLKENPQQRSEIAEAGYRLYLDKFSPFKLGEELKNIIIGVHNEH